MKKRKRLAVFMAGAALVLALSVTAGAAGPVLAPQPTAAFAQNQETKIEFSANTAVSVSGFQIQVEYDAAQLEPVRVEAGARYRPMSLASNLDGLKQQTKGRQQLTVVAAAPADASLKAGEALFSVTFKARQQSAPNISIQVKSAQLMGADLKTIDGVSGGSVDYGTTQLDPPEGSGLNRQEPSEGETGVNGYITGIGPALTMEQVLEKLAVDESQVTVTPSPQKPDSRREMPATGDKLTCGGDTVMLVVRGDVDGNGTVNVGDMVEIQRHLLQSSAPLTGAYFQAAYLTEKASPALNVADMVEIQRHLLGNQPL